METAVFIALLTLTTSASAQGHHLYDPVPNYNDPQVRIEQLELQYSMDKDQREMDDFSREVDAAIAENGE